MAREALAKAMLPTPDDIMTELDPLAALYYLDQLAWGCLKLWTAHLSDSVGGNDEVAADLAETLAGIATAVGELDEICARIGLAPDGAAVTATVGQ